MINTFQLDRLKKLAAGETGDLSLIDRDALMVLIEWYETDLKTSDVPKVTEEVEVATATSDEP